MSLIRGVPVPYWLRNLLKRNVSSRETGKRIVQHCKECGQHVFSRVQVLAFGQIFSGSQLTIGFTGLSVDATTAAL